MPYLLIHPNDYHFSFERFHQEIKHYFPQVCVSFCYYSDNNGFGTRVKLDLLGNVEPVLLDEYIYGCTYTVIYVNDGVVKTYEKEHGHEPSTIQSFPYSCTNGDG